MSSPDKLMPNSWHGGNAYKPSKSSEQAWSVHGGSAFLIGKGGQTLSFVEGRTSEGSVATAAKVMRRSSIPLVSSTGKVPSMSPLDKRLSRSLGVSVNAVADMTIRNAQILSSLSCDTRRSATRAAAPLDTDTSGKTIVDITAFRIDPSRVEQVLGVGAFASVHLATRIEDGLQCAIKVFHHPVSRGIASPSSSLHGGKLWAKQQTSHSLASIKDPRRNADDEYLPLHARTFRQEVKLLACAGLQHENIIAYLGHGFAPAGDGSLAGFIVTQYVDGVDLYSIVFQRKRGRALAVGKELNLPLAMKWGHQLSAAIAHLHANNVIHRDVKESNVIISAAEGCAILLDLGLAIKLRPPSSISCGEATPLRTTTIDLADKGFGVWGYRAPEVWLRRPYSAAIDIFAFGRMLHNLLSAIASPRQPMLQRVRRLRALAFHELCTAGGYPEKHVVRSRELLFCQLPCSSSWPADLRALIARCLSVEPNDRPGAQTVHAALETHMASSAEPI